MFLMSSISVPGGIRVSENDPQRNAGKDKLEAEPGAGRGGSREDAVPEQMEKLEAEADSKTRPVNPQAWQGEDQEVRGEKADQSPGHVASPEQRSEASKEYLRPGVEKPQD
jgi:hypothetical protein